MNFEDLTPEQQEKARACKTPEEMLALAKAEGYELSDEDLEMVSGGWNNTPTCPQCGSKKVKSVRLPDAEPTPRVPIAKAESI